MAECVAHEVRAGIDIVGDGEMSKPGFYTYVGERLAGFTPAPRPADAHLRRRLITHCSNIVEHPELIAERIGRFTRLVGLDRVIAGVDCGFSSQAMYRTEIHPTVIWAKFEALREGARVWRGVRT